MPLLPKVYFYRNYQVSKCKHDRVLSFPSTAERPRGSYLCDWDDMRGHLPGHGDHEKDLKPCEVRVSIDIRLQALARCD
jgi:hypothetical protein